MEFTNRLRYIDISGIRKMFELARAEGIINLAIGEPDFGIPPESKEAIKKALDEDFTHYTPNKGVMQLREALVKKLKKENGIKTDIEEIIITSGGSEALLLAILAIVNPNDEVLIPDPGFVSYKPLVRIAGGIPVSIPIKEENEFVFNLEDIEKKATEKTKMIVINSPSNPTGAVFSKDIVKGIAELCEKHDLSVVSDEVYEEIIYEGKHYSIGKYTDKAITVNGFSKSYAMTGLRLGYVQAKLEVVEEMLKIHQYIQASACSLSQRAALAALQTSEKFVENMVRTFKRRRDLIVELLNEIDDVNCLKPQGAFYVFPNFSKHGKSGKLVMNFLKDAKVVVTPGTAFGDYGEGYIRFSYATSANKITEGVKRIKNYICSKTN
jgi:aspartate aminotransferase